MEITVRELLIEKGHTTAVQIHDQINKMDARIPANGAKVVTPAWNDPEIKSALLADAGQASQNMGFNIGPMNLIAVENTASIHNLFVCTLCSCYPRNLLGLPPNWYKFRVYRSRTVVEPRRILLEFGVEIAQDVLVCVHDRTADMRCGVLPTQPIEATGLSEDELDHWVTRDSMIGVGLPQAPK